MGRSVTGMTVTHFSQKVDGLTIEVREEWGEDDYGFFVNGVRQCGFASRDEAVTYADSYASERYYAGGAA